jgi:tRNA(Ile)-lysidine synthase
MKLQIKFRDYCRKHRLLDHGDRILVAVSGGPDSLALLHLLHDLQDELSLRLEIAHVDHGLRGAEAKHDARFVAAWAARLGLPFHLRELDSVRRRARAGAGNLEQWARHERYAFFCSAARARNLNRVATAHTADDQAETVLMWLLRGAGGKGLGAIAPGQTMVCGDPRAGPAVSLIRPLLGISKVELLQLLEKHNLVYCCDRTNDDPGLLRNWLRHDLLPGIEKRFGRGVASRLARTAEVARDEALFLEELAREWLAKSCAKGAIDRAALLLQPRAVQRQILRVWHKLIRGDLRGVAFDHIEAILEIVSTGPPQSRLALPGGWQLLREYDALRLAKGELRRSSLRYSYALRADEPLPVPEAGVVIEAQWVSRAEGALPRDLSEALFDLDALTGSLEVRNFRPGDRFQPLGMAGHKKVKDLFIDKKAPRSARAVLPILVMGREILWLPGYARSAIGRIRPESRRVLHVRVIEQRC